MEALRLEGVGKRYGRKPVLQGVSLQVAPGEVYALAGPNGSGKTTLIRLVTGLAFPTEGRAFLLGEDVHQSPSARRHLGAVVEAPAAFYPYLTGRENLRLQAYLAGVREESRIGEVLARLRLLSVADQKVGSYSLGQRQRLGLAAAILHRPKVLVLDEPTSGLDPEGVELVHGLLRELSREGVAVLLSTHHLQEVSQYAHKVGILGGGRLLDEVALNGREVYRLEAHPPEGALALLKTLPQVAQARLQGGAILFEGNPEAALQALLQEGYRVKALYPERFDLLTYYQERVKHA
ncbi:MULTISPECIES: ABC transporter ATP-binding protein [Thermus]|jgi:ABC-2 type transport system ATP-binding protein|uniref:ABC transporter ATP-binding protein n=1 Tax=Thermus brockianus TaxID=56956 RepID=A0A1J0LSF5_THEBO|nr:ABC transporter ATP-binding protein [Thermus brockianus]APD09010.1 ABC transporter ATP-binding protein [Thermus brockianus]BDG15557.1 ABC transporter ATP-binding protein [Thermus brockianus]